MIVVDVNVLASRIVGEASLRRSAIALSERDPVWVAPQLWRYELGNILWKTVRFGNLAADFAVECLDVASELLEESVVDLDWQQTLEVAIEHNISYYDASYVALAQSRGLTLFTQDRKLVRKFPHCAQRMPSD